ncbi:hypothetical protein ACXWPL_10020, partial [Streptococcus pyogenes]
VDDLVKAGQLCYGCLDRFSHGGFFPAAFPAARTGVFYADIVNQPVEATPIRLTQLAHGGG